MVVIVVYYLLLFCEILWEIFKLKDLVIECYFIIKIIVCDRCKIKLLIIYLWFFLRILRNFVIEN